MTLANEGPPADEIAGMLHREGLTAARAAEITTDPAGKYWMPARVSAAMREIELGAGV